MTNTVNNVPRELLADLLGNDHDKRIMAERHLLAMLANAPSPAGVDGLEVVADVCGDGLGFLVGVLRSGHLFSAGESLCRLSGAQAIIDGLRGEVAKINSDRLACWAEFKVMTRACLDAEKERDQQAQRIGELEGLLREERTYASVPASCQQGVVGRCMCRNCRLLRIDAALSAGKDSDQ